MWSKFERLWIVLRLSLTELRYLKEVENVVLKESSMTLVKLFETTF